MTQLIALNKFKIERNNQELLKCDALSINFGEQIFLTGASGSGKTSLALALTGELYAHGEIKFNYQENSIFAKKITLVKQFFHFKNNYGLTDFYYQQRYNSYDADNAPTVRQTINKVINVDNPQVQSLLTLLDFHHRLDAILLQLSSGERKKIQLILALAKPTQIIILDNPLIGLDIITVKRLHEYMAKLAEEGVCFILTGDSNTIPKFITHVLSISAEHNLDKIKLDNYHPDTTTASTTNFNYANLKLPRLASTFTNIVKFNSVTISYAEKVALRNVSWLINQGDKWLLSGANGAGKSTLLSLINGDHPQAYANEIYLFDRKRGSGETIWDIKRNIGFISPELHWNFDGSMTCLQAVISGFYDTPSLHRGATDEQISIAQQWLEEASLIDYANQRFANVSNGIQRMLLLFRAIIKNPPLFILDEPCQGLDDYQAQQFVKLVDHLFADSQHTIIYVSHRADQIPTCISQQLNLVAGVATIIPAKNN